MDRPRSLLRQTRVVLVGLVLLGVPTIPATAAAATAAPDPAPVATWAPDPYTPARPAAPATSSPRAGSAPVVVVQKPIVVVPAQPIRQHHTHPSHPAARKPHAAGGRRHAVATTIPARHPQRPLPAAAAAAVFPLPAPARSDVPLAAALALAAFVVVSSTLVVVAARTL